jgi:hypothetical protein
MPDSGRPGFMGSLENGRSVSVLLSLMLFSFLGYCIVICLTTSVPFILGLYLA